MESSWQRAWAVAVLGACCCAPLAAHAQDVTIRLLMERAEGVRLQAGLRQQLAGKPLQIEIGEPPPGVTPRQRAATVLDTLRDRGEVTVLWVELAPTGERSLVALARCGRMRSAPLDARAWPDPSGTYRAASIVATSLLDELSASDTRGECASRTAVDPAPTKEPARRVVSREPPARATTEARDRDAPRGAAGLPPWVPIVGFAAASALGAAAYLAAPAPAGAAGGATSDVGGGSGATGTVPTTTPGVTARSQSATLSYVLAGSAAGLAAASVLSAVLLTDWGSEAPVAGDPTIELGLAPGAASVAVTHAF